MTQTNKDVQRRVAKPLNEGQSQAVIALMLMLLVFLFGSILWIASGGLG